jgi:hypothetical protein
VSPVSGLVLDSTLTSTVVPELSSPKMDRKNDETIASMAPEVSSPETDETLNVFLEYRLTSMLLALIAAINGPRDDPPQYEPPLERSQSSRRILNALANILV